MLLDSNIIIESCKPGREWLSPWTDHPDAAIASVTKVETLGFTGIDRREESSIRAYLDHCLSCPLDNEIIERAIVIRQQRKMKLGDAIIAATALEYDLPLATRNTRDFQHIEGLTLIDPFASDNDPEPADPSDA
jgi:toxin FitB